MSITVSFYGANYVIPGPGDVNTQSLTDFLAAVALRLGTVPAYLEVGNANSQVIPNNTGTIIVYATVINDPDLAYNVATGRYTVPLGKGGRYAITASVRMVTGGAGAGANEFNLHVYKNAADAAQLDDEAFSPGTTFQTSNAIGGSAIITCSAGDILDIRMLQTTGGTVTLGTNVINNRFVVFRLVS